MSGPILDEGGGLLLDEAGGAILQEGGLPYLAGTYTAGVGGVSIPFGATIVPDSAGQVTDNTTWSGLVEPIKIVKIFLAAGSDPSQAGAAPPTPNSTMLAANTAGASVLLVYEPAWAKTSGNTGQPSQAQLQTDLTNILASLAALTAAGPSQVTIAGVGLVNEPQNPSTGGSPKPSYSQYIAVQQYGYSGLGPYFPFTANHNSGACTFTVTGGPTGNQPYANGTPVQLQAPAGSSLPGGFSAATTYWVVGSSTTTFQLSATSGGSAIGSSSASSGSPTVAFLGWPFTGTNTSANLNAPGSAFTGSYPAGTPVFLTGGSLPTPFVANTTYYVVGGTGNNVQLSATSGGSAITATSGGSGNITYQGLHDAGWALCAIPDAGYAGHKVNDYFPGPSTVAIGGASYPARPATADYLCVDYYGGNYTAGKYLPTWFTLAAKAGMGVAVAESGNSATGPPGPSAAAIAAYISASTLPPAGSLYPGDPAFSMQACLTRAKAAGTPVLGSMWFQDNTGTGPNLITGPTDYRIPYLQSLAGSLSGLSATVTVSASVSVGDTVYVAALATAGTVTGVTDTRGSSYSLVKSQTTQAGAKLFVFAAYNTGAPAVSFTATHASPCVFTVSSGVFVLGDPVTLSGTSLPGGFSAGVTYYVDSPTPGAGTFTLSSTNPLLTTPSDVASTSAGSGTVTPATALNPGVDVITATYSSSSSVQAVAVIGDTGVTAPADVIVSNAGNSTSMSVATGVLSSQPGNVIAFYASQASGGTPTVGAQLTKLTQIETASTAWLTAAYKQVTSTASTTVTGSLSPAAQWSEIVAADVTQGAASDVAGIADTFSVIGRWAETAGIADSFGIMGRWADLAGIADSLSVVNLSAHVQQTPGTSTFDYGISTTEVTTTAGNCLVVLAGWDLSTQPTDAPMPAAFVTDSACNNWIHVATTTSSVTGARACAWICPNAAAIEWLSVSLTTFGSSLAYTILEIAGMATLYSLDLLDANAATGSSLTLAPGTTSGADFAFGILATGAVVVPPTTPAGWTALAPVQAGFGAPNPVEIFPFYRQATQGVNLATTLGLLPNYSVPVAGIVFAVRGIVSPPIVTSPKLPVLKVEAAFGTTPGDVSQPPPADPGGWTDLTLRTISKTGDQWVQTASGRTYELAQAEAGTLQIGFDNHDGALTPSAADTAGASPYYPDVVVETPVRVSAYWAGTWYPLDYGWVERWPQTWPDLPQFGLSKMIATDGISVMAATTMTSALLGDQLIDAPYLLLPGNEQYLSFNNGLNVVTGTLGYYSISDAQGFLANNYSRTNQRAGMYVDGNSAATGGSGQAIAETGLSTNLLGTSDTGFGSSAITTAPTTPASGPGIIYTDPAMPDPVDPGGVTVSFSLIIPAVVTSTSLQPVVFTAFGPPSNYQPQHASLTVQVQNFTGSNTLLITLADGSTLTAPFSVSAAAQQVTLCVTATSLLCYVNGALQTTATLSAAQTTAWNAIALGCCNYAYQSGGLVVGAFTAFSVAIYGYQLPQQRIVSQYATAISGQQNVDAVTRMAQILSWAGLGIPRAGRYTFNGARDGVLQGPAYSLSGQTAAAAVNQVSVNNTEMVSAWPNGSVVYTHKWGLLNQSPVAVFGDNTDPTAGEIPYTRLMAFDFDNTYLFNVAAFTQQYGQNQLFTMTAADFASQHSYWPRAAQAQTITTMSNQDAYTNANWFIAKYAQPSLRVSGIEIDAASCPQLAFPTVLQLLQGQVVTVIRRPVGGVVISQNVMVQKIEHSIGPDSWKVKLQLSPYDLEGNVLQLDAGGFNVIGANSLA